ncbi:MFS family permease [Catenulispora sp. EB89]|uniref:MFS transporter n=1 Tax=Catenulispora sp. EB89 TaxID=3156257 RepID=UPI00351634B2
MADKTTSTVDRTGGRVLLRRLPLGVLRTEPQFARVWASATISLMGTAVTGLALPLTAVITLHASAFQVGLLEATQWVPWLVIGLSAGVWVDRLKRRSVLMLSAVASALQLSVIPIAHAAGVLHVWMLFAVAGGVGTASVFNTSAGPAIVPTLVGPDHLLEANSLIRMSQSLAMAVGPGLAGALVALLSAPTAIVVDCTTWTIAALILVLTPIREEGQAGDSEAGSHFAQIKEGLDVLLRSRYLRPMIAVAAFGNFANGVWNAVFVLFAVRDLGISAGFLGLPLVFYGSVSLAAALTAPTVIRRTGVGRSMIVSSLVGNLPMLLIPFLPRGAVSIPFIVLPFAVAGLFSPVFNASMQSVMQASVPTRMLGRIGSTMTMLGWGMMPIGALIGGQLAAHHGYRMPLLIAAVSWNLATLGFIGSSVWSLHELPTGESSLDSGAAVTTATS